MNQCHPGLKLIPAFAGHVHIAKDKIKPKEGEHLLGFPRSSGNKSFIARLLQRHLKYLQDIPIIVNYEYLLI